MAAEHNFVLVALTRKNYLFAGSDEGGERAAIAYTILRCCRLADVEPVEYLTDVLTTLSRGMRRIDVPKLMPAQWAAAPQGCNFQTMLALNGVDTGRVVYIDQDLRKPSFAAEMSFLDWYERWADRV